MYSANAGHTLHCLFSCGIKCLFLNQICKHPMIVICKVDMIISTCFCLLIRGPKLKSLQANYLGQVKEKHFDVF